MFYFPTKIVTEKIAQAVSQVGDADACARAALGDRSNFVINRLFNSYHVDNTTTMTLLCRYAAYLLSVKLGPNLIQSITKTIRSFSNPSIDGWLF